MGATAHHTVWRALVPRLSAAIALPHPLVFRLKAPVDRSRSVGKAKPSLADRTPTRPATTTHLASCSARPRALARGTPVAFYPPMRVELSAVLGSHIGVREILTNLLPHPQHAKDTPPTHTDAHRRPPERTQPTGATDTIGHTPRTHREHDGQTAEAGGRQPRRWNAFVRLRGRSPSKCVGIE